jgi:hypothetical protein
LKTTDLAFDNLQPTNEFVVFLMHTKTAYPQGGMKAIGGKTLSLTENFVFSKSVGINQIQKMEATRIRSGAMDEIIDYASRFRNASRIVVRARRSRV